MDLFLLKIPDKIDNESLADFEYESISNELRRYQHCYSYYMVDKILESFYKIEDRKLEFINKKPYLKSRKKFFSISHSGEYVFLGFSDYECGVDMEKVTFRNYKKIASRMGFETPKTIEDFYEAWTLYEAKYKLGKKSSAYKTYHFEGFIGAACSENIQENFEIYFQTGKEFSKSEE